MTTNNVINAPIPFSMANGGTGASLTAAIGAIPYSGASVMALLANPGAAGKALLSGNAAAPTWSTPTYPSSSGSAGTILRSDGTNNVYSTSTFADTYAAQSILYASSSNTVVGLATVSNAVLTTNASGTIGWLSTTTDVAYNAGNFTASSGSWTVDAGDVDYFYYQVVGNIMTVIWSIRTSTVSATPATLNILIPASLSAFKAAQSTVTITQNNTSWSVSSASVAASGTNILLSAVPFGTSNWSTTTNLTGIVGQISFPIA